MIIFYEYWSFFDRSDFTEALYSYRQEQQTLAGLSLTQIEEGVLNIIRSKYPSKQVNKTCCFIHISIFIICLRLISTPLNMKWGFFLI